MDKRALAAGAVLTAAVVSLTATGPLEIPLTTVCISDLEGAQPTRDVTVALPERVVQAGTNYDTEPNVVDGFPSTCQALLRWDLSAVGTPVEIIEAEVFLQVTDASQSGIYVLGVNRGWEANGATWEHTDASGGTWAQPGAMADTLDVDPEPYAHFKPTLLGEHRIELNEVGLEAVNGWLAGTRANHGLLLRGLNEVDSLTFDNSVSANPPRLELTRSDGSVVVLVNTPTLGDTQADTSLCTPANENLDFHGLVVAGPAVGTSVALLRFDTASVPAGSLVLGARLELTGGGATVQARALRRPFDEQTATWLSASATEPWVAPGGQGELDHDPTSLGEYTSQPDDDRGALAFNEAGVAVVQGWVDDPQTNFGLMLRPTGEQGISFFTERSTPDPLRRPALCLDLQPKGELTLGTCGCGSSGSALLAGVLLLAALRRRRGATPTA